MYLPYFLEKYQMKSSEIREKFLAYFESKGHQRLESSSLVPDNDPTLLFTNAGMNQFKDLFLGNETRAYNRATTSQRCVRAGGKHNDLDNVGYTARHHTFFEMLGNFSFGDYFKEDAIAMAWEFLTKVIGLPEEKLWVTVHKEDTDAERIWKEVIGVNPDRFSHMGDKDNFWSMGDTGPCGPCSEIFYDHGENVPGGPPGSEGEDLDRYIEIWNLVFMQFNQQADGTRVPLPSPSVDTGMGLERLSAILQNVHSNYEIDIFQALIKKAGLLTGCKDLEQKSLRVIADHIRSAAFLISDGVLPSNEGRGYVLRRIIRRAIRHGNSVGASGLFFHKLADELANQMGEAYPELITRLEQIKKVLKLEEELFDKTLENGLKILTDEISELKSKVIPGSVAFKLYDTYGFPVDLTSDIARERDLEVDMEGFDRHMEEQKKRSKESSEFTAQISADLDLNISTKFDGYLRLECSGEIKAIISNHQQVTSLSESQEGILVLDQTAFYAESGGQVGDSGVIRCNGNEFLVTDTKKNGDSFLHIGKITKGSFSIGNKIETRVAKNSRLSTARHHSATHLLHAALRETLGDHVQQKGSLVDSEKLRFDFTHFEGVTSDELDTIANRVNEKILENSPVTTEIMSIDQAKAKGAMALFGEKYSDEVRVLAMGSGDFSIELCGGTHVSRTGDIGFVKILSESGIAAGIRRIEAVAGFKAIAHVEQVEEKLTEVQSLVKATPESVVEKIAQLISYNKQQDKEIAGLKQKLASKQSNELIDQAVMINGTSYLAVLVEGKEAKELRDMVDQLKNKLGSSVVVLATISDDKVQIVAGVTKDLIPGIKAGDVVNLVAGHVGGKGGGKPDLAMAGGTNPHGIQEGFAAFYDFAKIQ